MRFTFRGYEFIFRRIEKQPEPPPPTPPKRVNAILFPKKKGPKFVPSRKKCPVMDKVNYTREEAAKAEERIKNPYVRKYKCEFCEWWHMTHKRLKNG